jgi:hypothetical protein
MATKLEIDLREKEELQEAAYDVAPERVLDKIEETKSLTAST